MYSCWLRHPADSSIWETLCSISLRWLSGVCWPQDHCRPLIKTCNSTLCSRWHVCLHRSVIAFSCRSLAVLSCTHLFQSTWHPGTDFTKEVNPSLAKPPLNFNGGLAKLGLTSLVKSATDGWGRIAVGGDPCSAAVSWCLPQDMLSPVKSGSVFTDSCSPDVSCCLLIQTEILPPTSPPYLLVNFCSSRRISSAVWLFPSPASINVIVTWRVYERYDITEFRRV